MEYTVPDPRTIGYADLKELKHKLESTIRHIDQRIDGYVLCDCSICETYELGYEGTPPGWGWMRNSPGYLLCNRCIEKWTKKFGEPPNVFKEGDELEDNDI